MKPKEIFFTHYKENNVHNIFRLSMFQQFLVYKLNIKGCVIQCLAKEKLGTSHGQN